MRRIAFFGGSFDPVHNGHLLIAQRLSAVFALDEFVFIPAFHAPHKPDRKPTSAYHRYAMLSLATNDDPKLSISSMELEMPEKPYTFETLQRLKISYPDTRIFFVMGADSWMDILTWREWEKVLTLVDQIVVTRPGYEIGVSHVTDVIRKKIADMRGDILSIHDPRQVTRGTRIYITDAVDLDISASALRKDIKNDAPGWQAKLPAGVAKYLEKYQIYK
jgi:nicotinate-nucleotide adenylyltransferase